MSFPNDKIGEIILDTVRDSEGRPPNENAPNKFHHGSILYRREAMGTLLVLQTPETILKTNTPVRQAHRQPPYWRWYVLVME